MRSSVRPAAIGKPELKLLRGSLRDVALLQISADGRTVLPSRDWPESAPVGNLVHLIKRRAQAGLVVAGLRLLRQRDAVLVGQFLERFPERETFDGHHEVEDIALGVAAVAIVKLVFGVDGKRGRLLVVERAQAGVAVSETAQARHVIRDHADDVDLRFQFLGEIHTRGGGSLSSII